MHRALSWRLSQDFEAVVDSLGNDWHSLADSRLFVTGGTGFIGRWLLESLALANDRHALGVEVVVLTRNPAAFATKAPHLAANPMFTFVAGDVCDGDWPVGPFSHIIHAATDASAHLNEHDPRRMFDTIVTGTRRALDFTAAQPSARMMFFSSGAVYGIQPWEITHVGEDFRGSPHCQDPRSAYGEGKRAAEMLCGIYRKQFGVDVVTARIFAALGPFLSLDIHFAAGNFIRDVLAGKTITVQGAGTAVRSLLYTSDLTTWLWAVLLRGQEGMAYNVGSESAISIADLARRIADVLGGPPVEILGRPDPGWNPGRYVPSTALIRDGLAVKETVGLDEAIRRTAIWNGWKQ